MAEEEVQFKPCPFCGSDQATVMSNKYVECLICHCRGPAGMTALAALMGWALRAQADTEGKAGA